MHLLDLMEPEETVGNLWHDIASALVRDENAGVAVTLADLRGSLAMLFRALGGRAGVELAEAPMIKAQSKGALKDALGGPQMEQGAAGYDGSSLRLPAEISRFDDPALNRAAYLWLTAVAAMVTFDDESGAPSDLIEAAQRAYAACPGLRAQVPTLVKGGVNLTLGAPDYGPAAEVSDETKAPPASATRTHKKGLRKDMGEADRRDSFIIHRFESILSWVESMNLNRSVDDDDDENAQKAADDQEDITLSKNNKRAATRLRLSLDLSPSEADREKLAGVFTYPEWNHRARDLMPDHCRVLDMPAEPKWDSALTKDSPHMRAVRRQFEALRPRRVLRPRQLDGAELDLDAVIAAQADLAATGESSDRIYQNARQIERDLAVAFLIDTSRSTESALGDTTVLEIAQQALIALAGGIDAAGDRLGVWGFSSLRRDRVYMTCCKTFDAPMGPEVTANIAGLTPGHYTRLGAAIRHTSAMLAKQQAARKLLIVLTDGKPNDLDHYEGRHGIEDSHMAVRAARRSGQALHGIVLDEDGQDWFARIFGRGGFSLLPDPQRLTRALPDIYRHLTQEV